MSEYYCIFQDGSERVIESLSLIDAVMPDVVESRKQAAAKSQQIKADTNNANGGDDAANALSKYITHSRSDKSLLFNTPTQYREKHSRPHL